MFEFGFYRFLFLLALLGSGKDSLQFEWISTSGRKPTPAGPCRSLTMTLSGGQSEFGIDEVLLDKTSFLASLHCCGELD